MHSNIILTASVIQCQDQRILHKQLEKKWRGNEFAPIAENLFGRTNTKHDLEAIYMKQSEYEYWKSKAKAGMEKYPNRRFYRLFDMYLDDLKKT